MELVKFRAQKGLFYIQLVGNLEFYTSAALETILVWIKNDKSIKRVIVDLSKARVIDSTNLGLIAQLGLYANQKHNYVPILAPGATPSVKKTLSRLQLDNLFRWKGEEESFDSLEENLIQFLGPSQESEKSICERAIAAHQTLMSLSESNRAEFRIVVAGLKVEKALLRNLDESEEDIQEDVKMDNLNDLKINQPCFVSLSVSTGYVH